MIGSENSLFDYARCVTSFCRRYRNHITRVEISPGYTENFGNLNLQIDTEIDFTVSSNPWSLKDKTSLEIAVNRMYESYLYSVKRFSVRIRKTDDYDREAEFRNAGEVDFFTDLVQYLLTTDMGDNMHIVLNRIEKNWAKCQLCDKEFNQYLSKSNFDSLQLCEACLIKNLRLNFGACARQELQKYTQAMYCMEPKVIGEVLTLAMAKRKITKAKKQLITQNQTK